MERISFLMCLTILKKNSDGYRAGNGFVIMTQKASKKKTKAILTFRR